MMNIFLKTGITLCLSIACLTAFAQKKSHSFTVSRTIAASADEVWAVVGEDFGAIANSHPKIVSSNYINGSLKSGEGAERVCHFNDEKTKYVHEKQVNYDPENRSFKVQVLHSEDIPLDPEYSFAVYKVKEVNASASELSVEMTFRTKPAVMGAVAKGNFKKTLDAYLLAVEHHVKTGEIVNKETFKDIKKQYKE